MQHSARQTSVPAKPRVSRTAGPVRPLLKWAGGKRQLLPRLRAFYPSAFGAYLEPFFGSGAVFFDLVNRRLLDGHEVVLMDNNADLIGCYRVVRDRAEAVIRRLQKLAGERADDPHGHYYEVRDRRFNSIRQELLARGNGVGEAYTADLAAMLIYLNRTGFNGLFRLNARGRFNVPVGRYVNPRICDAVNLRRVSRALSSTHARLLQGDFADVLDIARPGDFLYFDPPYVPISSTAFFTSYTSGGFGEEAQVRLQRTIVELAQRGCQVLLSNSTAPLVARLYDHNDEARKAGLRAYKAPARRAINCDAAARQEVLEYVITNMEETRESSS